jgi:ubiquinone/menaquinone biosynthesis C-methylase UbiE
MKNKVCSVEHAGALDTNLRKLFHNPQRILKPYIKEGMKVLDLGCGPGFFSIEIAKMVGVSGKVIAADLQDGMLEKLNEKIKDTNLQKIIELHKCQNDKIGLTVKFDFILLFYILHEITNQSLALIELKTLLKPNGKILIVEPKFHVNKNDFNNSIIIIKNNGFNIIEEPKILFSRSILIKNS